MRLAVQMSSQFQLDRSSKHWPGKTQSQGPVDACLLRSAGALNHRPTQMTNILRWHPVPGERPSCGQECPASTEEQMQVLTKIFPSSSSSQSVGSFPRRSLVG